MGHSVEGEIKDAQFVSCQVWIISESLLDNGEVLKDVGGLNLDSSFLHLSECVIPIAWAIAATDGQAVGCTAAHPLLNGPPHIPAVLQVVLNACDLHAVSHLLLECDVFL